MNNITIDTVIFDLGGVLIDWNPVHMYKNVFEDEAEMKYFLSEICSPHWNEQQDAGRPLAEATQWLVARHPEYEQEIRQYYDSWTDMLSGAIKGTVDILEQLHSQATHRLLALTNWSHETFPTALELFDFLHKFEGILVSGEEKLIKPDPRIYELLISRYGIEPSRAVFIDDNPRNVEGARNTGLHAIRFESPQQLQAELAGYGVVVGG